MVLPNLPPQPERQRKVTISQRDHGPHGQGVGGPVECTGAARAGAGFKPAPAIERGERSPPVAGRCLLDRQHLT